MDFFFAGCSDRANIEILLEMLLPMLALKLSVEVCWVKSPYLHAGVPELHMA